MNEKIYSIDPEFAETLQPPTIDGPVAASTSSNILANEAEEGLKGEDKKVEQTLHKVHQAAPWSVEPTTTASFFSRVVLVWLHQMQDRAPPGYLRSQQDLNKVLAMMELITDPTLNGAKYASKAIASSVEIRTGYAQ
uniref:Uncharacterized protein n=1 Tax=Micrurus carvalhoi TaxID=3147026 RepID=A0A2H6NG04_9SAUR